MKAGVHAPGRWEWSPLYFKEINWVGSNAFGFEDVEGQRKHAIAHYLDLVVYGRVDLRPMLTHTFRLERGTVVAKVSSLLPGDRASKAARVRRGEYRFFCALSNHEQLGMYGTLVVR